MDKDLLLRKFGSSVRRERLSAGLSQEELASQVDLDRSYLGAIERGEHNLSLWNIHKITSGLGISLVQLFDSVEGSEE